MEKSLPPEQRIVVTGMGAITPTGLDMPTTWSGVRDGLSGIRPITLFDTSDFKVTIAGEAHGFDPLNHFTRKEIRRIDRFSQFAVVAAEEAVRHARLEVSASNAGDVGVYVGSGAGGCTTYQVAQQRMNAKGYGQMNPLMIPMILIDSAAVHVGIRLGAKGPNLGMASACSTSVDAVGLALETIRRGDASVMIAGGAEASINTLGIGGFDNLRALSRRNHDPLGASRPFDSARDGFVLSEGAVVLVIESLTHAQARGVEPLAELTAWATNSDARHLTAPDQTGSGALRCMRRALEKAKLSVRDVDYINAHATATPLGDPIEATAIRTLFDNGNSGAHVSSTKSVTGHLLGAAGALATAVTVEAMAHSFIPPTINLADPGPDCELNHVANVGIDRTIDVALVPSYGFGGHNSCLVVRKI